MPILKHNRVVLTPGGEMPYKVVIEHRDGTSSEHPVSTIREGEALIRVHEPSRQSSNEVEAERECPLLHGHNPLQ